MSAKNGFLGAVMVVWFAAVAIAAPPPRPNPLPSQAAAGQSGVARRIGAITAINGGTITLKPDSGPEVTVTPQANARVLRIEPGQKDLKNATPIALTDLQVGDRILVGGKLADDASSLAATTIVVMKHSDVLAHQQEMRQDWQKRGIGGLVSAVDPATHTITVSVTGFGGTKEIAVHTTNDTVFRRYAPESVKFEDAKPSTMQDVRPGDQLRARGTRSAQGTEFAAEEIVTGSFRNIAGLVNSVDATAGTITVQDLLSKKSVEIKVTSESQLHQLSPEMAQRIAMRLKGMMSGAAGGGPNAASPAAHGQSPAEAPHAAGATEASGNGQGAGAGGGMSAGMRAGAPDFQQMLSHLPAVTVGDLHKGAAVLVVATEGSPASASTAITLVSGVEPILQAAPNAGQAMMLAPWSLGGAPGGDAASQ